MKIEIYAEGYEKNQNIAIAQAMTETSLSDCDLREIAQYLMVFSDNRRIEREREQWRQIEN